MATTTSCVGKKLYLDSFVYAHIAKEPSLSHDVRETILREGFTLVVSTINLIEFLPNRKRLDAITDFISSVPFAIAGNLDRLVDEEVRSYPSPASIPFGFISRQESFSAEELKEAIQDNLVRKIQSFRDGFVTTAEKTFEEVLRTRDSGQASLTNSDEIELFLMSNVLAMLHGSHPKFTKDQISAGHAISVQHFKSYSVQTLVIFEDYYQQRKQGQPSDISDILQLAYAPYVDLAVFDNAKLDTLRRLRKRNILTYPVSCQNLAEFRRACAPPISDPI